MKRWLKSMIYVISACILLGSYGTMQEVGIRDLSVHAASKKSIVVYEDVIKKGNIVYCASYVGLQKINLKTKKTKNLVKKDLDGFPSFMILKGKWLFYNYFSGGTTSCVCRVNVNNGKIQILGNNEISIAGKKFDNVYYEKIAIKGSRIYCQCYNETNDGKSESFNMSMGLNGKKKKLISSGIKTQKKKSNKSGYRIDSKRVRTGDHVYEYYYLKTPKTEYYLGYQ